MPTSEAVSGSHPPNPKLVTVAERHLVTKCKPSTLTYCRSMDLIALATENEQVHIFRLNGQEASGGPFGKQGVSVRGTRWNLNGNILAIAGSDNIVRLVSAYSGKTVHELPCVPAALQGKGHASISCVGWGAHLTNARASLEDAMHEGRDDVDDGTGKTALEDVLSEPSSGSVQRLHRIAAYLPRELAVLDVERSLPKLSVLPSTGDDDDVFSSRASLDSMFEAASGDSTDGVDVLLAGFDDGTVHLRIFNCFEIGSLNIRSSFAGVPETIGRCRALQHSWSPPSSTHSLLFSVSSDSSDSSGRAPQIRLLTLDLLFVNKSGQYLSLLASKVTQLQNLLRYIKQTQNQISLEWKNAQELPSRFIANVDEDLQEKYQCDFVTAAYHLIVTGNCFEPVKEFFVDQVGERGHKRWEKAVGSGYETIQRLTHECLLPALERCGVLLSRLVGLSKYHRISPVLGLETKDLKECLESVDCLNLLCHKILNNASREYREFCAFSKWLRHEIDLQAAEPLSAAEDELMAASDAVDYPLTLTYVRGAMTRSALGNFIKATTTTSDVPNEMANTVRPTANGSFYESYKRQLRQQEEQKQKQQKPGGEPVVLPKLGDLVFRLQGQCDKVFSRVAETQRRGILHRSPLTLSPDCDEDVMDMLMGFMKCDDQIMDTVRIVSKSQQHPYEFYIYSVILDSVNGVSSTKDVRVTCISLQSGNIKSIKFVDEENRLLMLWRDGGPSFSTHLVSLPLNPIPACTSKQEIQLQPADAARGVDIPWDQRQDLVVQIDLVSLQNSDKGWIWHTFDDEGVGEDGPVSLEVNPLKGRRAVCVLYADGLRYEVLDMDNTVQEDDEDENEEGGEEL